jgi:hypothetical protein
MVPKLMEISFEDWLEAVKIERARHAELGYDLRHDSYAGVQHLLAVTLDYMAHGENLKASSMLLAISELV